MKKAREVALREGRCGRCRQKALLPGHVACRACIKLQREGGRQRHAARAAAGLCRYCGKNRPDEGVKDCGPCRKKQLAIHWKTLYGLNVEQYREKRRAQGGRCAICGRRPTGRGKTNKLYVDHNHRTGHLRALLCHYCNSAIGSLREDPALCRAAAAYLERWATGARVKSE